MSRGEKKLLLKLIKELRELKQRLDEDEIEIAEVERLVLQNYKDSSTFLLSE